MKIKNNLLIALFISHFCILTAMDQKPAIAPINRIFLNACKNDKTIEFSLKHGADINVIDPDNGYNGLHYACKNGNIDRINLFIEHGLAIDDRAKNCLNKALITLSQNRQLCSKIFQKQTKALLDLGADVNATDPACHNFSPLSYACFNCNVANASFLLQHKANVNHISTLGTPLYLLFSLSKNVLFSNDTSSPKSIFFDRHDERKSGRYALMSLLLENNADVTILAPENHSVLQAAIFGDNTKCAKVLIATKKCRDNVDIKGHNAIYTLLANYTKDARSLLKSLLEKGIKPLIDIEEVSSMHVAVIRGSHCNVDEAIDLIDMLHSAGVGVNDQDKDGQTPLHYCAKECTNPTIVQKLLNLGAQQISDNDEKTPIQLIQNNPKYKKQIIQILKKGPSTNITKNEATTAEPEKTAQKKNTKKTQPALKTTKKNKKVTQETIKSIQPESTNIELYDTQSNILPKTTTAILSEPATKTSTNIVEPSEPIAISQPKKLKNQKPSLLERAQEAVIKIATGQSTKTITQKTYAQALNLSTAVMQMPQEEKKDITFVDDHLTITVPAAEQLMLTSSQNNLLVDTHTYSNHVLEKMAYDTDIFHNFSPDVEKNIGQFASSNLTKSGTIYTIPATIRTPLGNLFNGAFEFFVTNEGMMTHRFFNPEKKDKKMLPAPTDIN